MLAVRCSGIINVLADGFMTDWSSRMVNAYSTGYLFRRPPNLKIWKNICTNIFITQPVMIVRVFCSQACGPATVRGFQGNSRTLKKSCGQSHGWLYLCYTLRQYNPGHPGLNEHSFFHNTEYSIFLSAYLSVALRYWTGGRK